MTKLSDFPDGTIVETDNELFKKKGYNWVRLDSSDGSFYVVGAMDTRQARGEVAIVGIPYPVALKLAEWLGGEYPAYLGVRDPEQLILDAAKEI
jgi:hypothetical protein